MFSPRVWFCFWGAWSGFFLAQDIERGDDPTFWIVLLALWLILAVFTDVTDERK
jgi:membrane-associated protease RseP (regulator of RpoE activity)